VRIQIEQQEITHEIAEHRRMEAAEIITNQRPRPPMLGQVRKRECKLPSARRRI